MHPWNKIIRGNTDKFKMKACLICLERIKDSDDNIELKLHLFKIHSVKVHLKKLVQMCNTTEEREEREGWSLDDVVEEGRDRREAELREREESGGWLAMFWRKKKPHYCLDSNAEVDEVDCFLCQEQLKSFEYNKHLEMQHGVIFGEKDIKKVGIKDERVPLNQVSGYENGEPEPEIPEITRTDADTVKNLVEMKFLPKKKKMRLRLRSHTQKLFSKKYQVLIGEVCSYPISINCLFFF